MFSSIKAANKRDVKSPHGVSKSETSGPRSSWSVVARVFFLKKETQVQSRISTGQCQGSTLYLYLGFAVVLECLYHRLSFSFDFVPQS